LLLSLHIIVTLVKMLLIIVRDFRSFVCAMFDKTVLICLTKSGRPK
jgi:hypothetical protein